MSSAELTKYKLVVVPALYVADDHLLKELSDYVEQGGHVLMTFKSGFANENSAVRWEKAPGPLAKAAGFTYQEFSNLDQPLALRDDPFHVGADANMVGTRAEFFVPDTAQPLAYYSHPFFGRWPAITTNHFGAGSLTYEGTAVSLPIQRQIVLGELKNAGLTSSDQNLPPKVHIKHAFKISG